MNVSVRQNAIKVYTELKIQWYSNTDPLDPRSGTLTAWLLESNCQVETSAVNNAVQCILLY